MTLPPYRLSCRGWSSEGSGGFYALLPIVGCYSIICRNDFFKIAVLNLILKFLGTVNMEIDIEIEDYINRIKIRIF